MYFERVNCNLEFVHGGLLSSPEMRYNILGMNQTEEKK